MRAVDNFSVTVVMPVFIRELTALELSQFRLALQSIQIQKFPASYEILIIDDGSVVPVETLLSGFKNGEGRNVRVLRNFRNQGLVYSLNRGISEAKCAWIARLDADDTWAPGKIEKQFDLITRDPDLTIVATGMSLFTPKGGFIESHIRPGDWKGILDFFVKVGCPFPHGSILGKRDIFLTLGGYSHSPDVSHCEDYALWGKWLRFFKPAMVEESLYNYTVSDKSVSAIHGEQQRRASRNVNITFSALKLTNVLPEALTKLSVAMQCSLMRAGEIACNVSNGIKLTGVNKEAVDALQVILNDRVLVVEAQLNQGKKQESMDRLFTVGI